MKNKNIIYISIFLFLLLLTGCEKKHTHNYSLEWEWGEDVVAIFTCDCGEDSTQKLLASVEEEVIAEADCINDGEIRVTAKVIFNNVLYEKTKIVTIPKKGHDISTVIEPGFVSEGYTADICSRCNYIFNKYAYTKPILKLEYISDGYYVVTGVNDYNVSEIVIPKEYNGSSVQKIGDEAFAYCTNLKSVIIPDSVTKIGSSAFNNCTNLTSIDVSKNNNYYKSIDGNLYSKDGAKLIQYAIGKKQNEFVIPDSVTGIGDSAFSDCSSLTNITIPDSVTNIEYSAFNNCTNLTSVIIPDSVTNIGYSAFNNCTNLTSVIIPDSVTKIESTAFFNCTNLTSIDVSKNNNYYKSIDGNLYSKDGAKLIQYAIGKKQNEFVIPDSVTNIGPYAFNNCTNLTNVIIPDSVTNIEHSAFNNCTNLTIYCESTSKPIGWDYYWNGSNRPVVWGYK